MDKTTFNNKLKLFHKTGNLPQQAEIGLDLCTYLNEKGDFEECRNIGLTALKAAQLLKKYKIGADICCVIALSYENQDDYEQAKEYLTKAISHAKHSKNDLCLAKVYKNLGSIENKLGNNKEAIEYLLQAMSIGEAGNKEILSEVYTKLAHVSIDINDMENGELYFTKLINFNKGTEGFELTLRTNEHIGNYLIYRNKNALGVEYYRKNYDLAKAKGDLYNMAYALGNISLQSLDDSNLSECLKDLSEAIKIAEENSFDNLLAQFYHTMGLYHYFGQHLDEALAYLRKAFRVKSKTEFSAKAAHFLSYINYFREDFALSIGYSKWAIRFCEANNLTNLMAYFDTITIVGSAYHMKGDLQKAKEYCNKSIQLAEKNNNIASKLSAKFSLAQIFTEEKEYVKAKNIYKEIMQIVEVPLEKNKMMKSHFEDKATRLPLYKNYSDLLMKMENYKEATKYLQIYADLLNKVHEEDMKAHKAIKEAQGD
jgi:tetratricopeptide (TPR) repeat protein